MKNLIFCFLFFISFSTYASLPIGIDWHTGSVSEAFILAKKSSKPLFLYWGAVWCPPCNQIKKTIFSTDQFKTVIKNFIPVYLDGDSKDAQTWGEKLKTSGYPTMIVMTADYKEIMRMPTGISADEYVHLMKNSLEMLKPMNEIVKLALRGKATTSDWERIVAHSWGQDEGMAIDLKLRKKNLKNS